MSKYEDFTSAYREKPTTSLEGLKRGGYLFVGELLKTDGGRVLIPMLGQGVANVFAVFLATDVLTLVGEFQSFKEADLFLDRAEAQGWEVVRSHPCFSGINWLAGEEPDLADIDFPWIRNEFPHWLTQVSAA